MNKTLIIIEAASKFQNSFSAQNVVAFLSENNFTAYREDVTVVLEVLVNSNMLNRNGYNNDGATLYKTL